MRAERMLHRLSALRRDLRRAPRRVGRETGRAMAGLAFCPPPSIAARLTVPRHPSGMMSLGRVGQYELLRKLPHGGNADVFVAVADDSDYEVALKCLRSKPGSEPWRRFVQEVQVVTQLGAFPGILPILHSGIADDPKPEDRAW